LKNGPTPNPSQGRGKSPPLAKGSKKKKPTPNPSQGRGKQWKKDNKIRRGEVKLGIRIRV
jgi:hypothetical protein